MDEVSLRKELCILLCHHLRTKLPDIYKQLCDYAQENNLIPNGCSSIEEALNLRYSSFSDDHFVKFIRSLRPQDDYPSIFRRITPFPKQVENFNIHSIKAYSRTNVHRDAIYCICTDPAGRILATGSDDKQIKIWGLPDLKPIITFSGHENVITNININPLCTLLVSSSDDKTVRIWSLKTGQCLSVLGGFTSDVIHFCTFSPTGSMIAAGCEDGTINLWTTADALQGKAPNHVFKSPGKGAVRWISFSPGGEFLAYSSEPNCLVIIPLKTLNECHLVSGHESVCDFVLFSSRLYSNHGEPGPRLFTVSREDGFGDTWLLENLVWKKQFIFKNTSSTGRKAAKIKAAAMDCDENLVVIARTSGVYVYQMMTGELVGHIVECAACNGCVAVAPHPTIPRLFFIANRTGEVAIIDSLKSHIVCQTSLSIDPNLIDAVWSPDGKWIYATDAYGTVTSFIINGLPLPDTEFAREIFESPELSHDGVRVFTDSRGQILPRQPQYLDIRNLDLGFQMLQGPVIQAAAAELHIIQRIASGERLPQPVTEAVSAVAAPPQHIRCTIEPPFNPHGPPPPPAPPPATDIADNEEEHGPVVIESDTDDWEFGGEGTEGQPADSAQSESEEKFVMPIITSHVPKGIWPVWETCVVCDESIFIPQVGDEVFFLKDVYALTNTAPLPDEAGFIENAARSCVLDVQPAEEGSMDVTLLFPQQQNIKMTLRMTYPNPQYLVDVFRYRMAIDLEKSVTSGTSISFIVHSGGFAFDIADGVVEAVHEDQGHYCSISVRVGDDVHEISPWNIYAVDGKKVKYPDSAPKILECGFYVTRMLEAHSGDQSFEYFDEAVRSEAFKKVPIPMSLGFFRERLTSGYYRSFTSIRHDKGILQECMKEVLSDNTEALSKVNEMISNIESVLDIKEKEILDRIKKAREKKI